MESFTLLSRLFLRMAAWLILCVLVICKSAWAGDKARPGSKPSVSHEAPSQPADAADASILTLSHCGEVFAMDMSDWHTVSLFRVRLNGRTIPPEHLIIVYSTTGYRIPYSTASVLGENWTLLPQYTEDGYPAQNVYVTALFPFVPVRSRPGGNMLVFDGLDLTMNDLEDLTADFVRTRTTTTEIDFRVEPSAADTCEDFASLAAWTDPHRVLAKEPGLAPSIEVIRKSTDAVSGRSASEGSRPATMPASKGVPFDFDGIKGMVLAGERSEGASILKSGTVSPIRVFTSNESKQSLGNVRVCLRPRRVPDASCLLEFPKGTLRLLPKEGAGEAPQEETAVWEPKEQFEFIFPMEISPGCRGKSFELELKLSGAFPGRGRGPIGFARIELNVE